MPTSQTRAQTKPPYPTLPTRWVTRLRRLRNLTQNTEFLHEDRPGVVRGDVRTGVLVQLSGAPWPEILDPDTLVKVRQREIV